MTARFGGTRGLFAGLLFLAAAAVWAVHHALAIAGLLPEHLGSGRLAVLWAAAYLWLVWQLGFAWLNRPITVSRRNQRHLDRLTVAALVPVYNEDPGALRKCLASLLHQTRTPQTVVVVDDGSTDPDALEPVRAWFETAAAEAGVEAVWVRQDNAGKRFAQMRGVAYAPTADVYWTTDSDTISDVNALGELLKPLANPKVQSVAGLHMTANIRTSLIARIYDVWFVAGQLTDRSSLSVLGAVWVNSGPIAVYRGEVVRRYARTYLTETFAGRTVMFSDDSLLTLFAMLNGRTVQQPSAFAFALMPENMSHLCRMYLRWMRGSTIRSLWRAKYLPLSNAAFWVHAIRWTSLVMTTGLAVWFLGFAPLHSYNLTALWWLLGVPLAVGYAQTLRWLAIKRSDQSTAYQLATWLMTPLAVLFSATVLRWLRWYGIATCWRTGWGTRATVEVGLGEADQPADVGPAVAPVHTAAHGPTLLLQQVRGKAAVR